MRNGVPIETEVSGNVTKPGRGLQSLAASGDDLRAVLALCLAASLLSIYTIAWATGAVSI